MSAHFSLTKKFFAFLFFNLFLVFLLCVFAEGVNAGEKAQTAVLYRGNTALGTIPVMEGSSGPSVSLVDMASLMGFTATTVGEELHLVCGNVTLRVILNAVAAWHNVYLIPLYEACFEKDGRWWLGMPSAELLFRRFAGADQKNRVRLELSQDGLQMAEKQQSKPDKPVVDVTAEPSGELETSKETADKKSTSEVKLTEVLALRWSTSREKVRAVIDCAELAEPEVNISLGKVQVNFSGDVSELPGIPSPYENVAVELNRGAKTSLVFSSASQKVEKILLENPKRIVLDFIFAASSDIRETQSIKFVKDPGIEKKDPKIRKGKKLLVVLDPGHGGKDPGAVANGVNEKDLNLAIGLEMERALLAKGFDVHMTRRTDVYLKLQERTDIANRYNADMFVSIHANALPTKKSIAGFEIYIMALPTDKDALELAKIENRELVEGNSNHSHKAVDRKTELLLKILGDMQQNNKISESTTAAESLFQAGKNSGLPMRRVAQAPFFVLRGAGMPAVLLETGYVTNASEAKLLSNSGYQRRISEAMAAGILDYLK